MIIYIILACIFMFTLIFYLTSVIMKIIEKAKKTTPKNIYGQVLRRSRRENIKHLVIPLVVASGFSIVCGILLAAFV